MWILSCVSIVVSVYLAPSDKLSKEDEAGNQKTAKVIFTAAKASTIHGRYFPIFIKKLSKIMTPSSFDVLGIELEDEDDESFSDIQVYLYTTINNLSVNKYLLINFLNVPKPKTRLQNAVEKICELSVST